MYDGNYSSDAIAVWLLPFSLLAWVIVLCILCIYVFGRIIFSDISIDDDVARCEKISYIFNAHVVVFISGFVASFFFRNPDHVIFNET